MDGTGGYRTGSPSVVRIVSANQEQDEQHAHLSGPVLSMSTKQTRDMDEPIGNGVSTTEEERYDQMHPHEEETSVAAQRQEGEAAPALEPRSPDLLDSDGAAVEQGGHAENKTAEAEGKGDGGSEPGEAADFHDVEEPEEDAVRAAAEQLDKVKVSAAATASAAADTGGEDGVRPAEIGPFPACRSQSLQEDGAVKEASLPSSDPPTPPPPLPSPPPPLSLRSQEDRALGGSEILFSRNDDNRSCPLIGGGGSSWDNLRWLSHSGERVLKSFCHPIYRAFTSEDQATSVWSKLASSIAGGLSSSSPTRYEPRALAIYQSPPVVLVLRRPSGTAEVGQILGVPTSIDGTCEQDPSLFLSSEDSSVDRYWIVETVVDPALCKLRLSPLTTLGAIPGKSAMEEDPRRNTCFELVAPHESVLLSTVQVRTGKAGTGGGSCWTDSGALLETSAVETALVQAMEAAHNRQHEGTAGNNQAGSCWRHQCVLGTVHSHVVTANLKSLEKAIEHAAARAEAMVPPDLIDESDRHRERQRLIVKAIDEEDDMGLTPLYYACLRRMSHAVTLLVGAGARVDFVPSRDPSGSSLAHLCARNLDPLSLSVLLSACQVSSSSAVLVPSSEASAAPAPPPPPCIANSLDALGRTPMDVAATEGSTAAGGSDPTSLKKCILALQAWGGSFFADTPATASRQETMGETVAALSPCTPSLPLLHPVAVLAGRWRPEELAVVLERVPVRYPWHGSASKRGGKSSSAFEILRVDASSGMSLSAKYQYPLHRAVASLANYLASASSPDLIEDEHSLEPRLVRTLRVLLEHSFEPNERLEVRDDDPLWSSEHAGYTPLQILASIALEAAGAGIDDTRSRLVYEAAELLVRSGARLSIDSPPSHRPRRLPGGKESQLHGGGGGGGSSNHYHGSSTSSRRGANVKLKLDSKEALAALGGEKRLNAAHKEWIDLKPVEACESAFTLLLHDGDEPLESTDAPGGSNEKSCAICWKEFGTLTHRKHRCRLTRRYLCDACSGKRLLVVQQASPAAAVQQQQQQHCRVSDGQFMMARIDAAKERSERAAAQARADEERERVAQEARAQARQQRMEAEAQSNRDSLLGGLMGHAANLVFGNDDDGMPGSAASAASSSTALPSATAQQRQQQNVRGLASSLSETRNAMLERGQKLQDLGDKSAKLVDASSDFARMAKELRKKSESRGLFW